MWPAHLNIFFFCKHDVLREVSMRHKMFISRKDKSMENMLGEAQEKETARKRSQNQLRESFFFFRWLVGLFRKKKRKRIYLKHCMALHIRRQSWPVVKIVPWSNATAH